MGRGVGGAWPGGRGAAGPARPPPAPPLAPWIEVGATLARACAPLPDEPWVGPLAALLPAHVAARPAEGPPDLAQGRLFEAVVALLAESARRAPPVVILEDLHAADEATRMLLAYVSRRVPQTRGLLVAPRRGRPPRDQLVTLLQASRQRGTLRADVH